MIQVFTLSLLIDIYYSVWTSIRYYMFCEFFVGNYFAVDVSDRQIEHRGTSHTGRTARVSYTAHQKLVVNFELDPYMCDVRWSRLPVASSTSIMLTHQSIQTRDAISAAHTAVHNTSEKTVASQNNDT